MKHRSTPPQSQAHASAHSAPLAQMPQMLPPHHYSHPSLSPLVAQQQRVDPQRPEIGALLNTPGKEGVSSASGSPQQSHQQPPLAQDAVQAPHGVKRPGSPLEQPPHTPQQPEVQQVVGSSPHVVPGSIPNSPRTERRDAPAAYRASN